MAIYDWLSDDALELKVHELRARAHVANGNNYAARARDWEVAHNALLARYVYPGMVKATLTRSEPHAQQDPA